MSLYSQPQIVSSVMDSAELLAIIYSVIDFTAGRRRRLVVPSVPGRGWGGRGGGGTMQGDREMRCGF